MSNQLSVLYYIVFLLMLFPIYVLFSRYRSKKIYLNVFSAIMNASDFGQIVFDVKGDLLCMNDRAAVRRDAFIDCKDGKATLSKFWDYLYDHSVDYDDNIKDTVLSYSNFGDIASEFCEVIRCDEGGLYLVDARKLVNGMTLFSLIDLSYVQQREEQFQHLDKLSFQLMQAAQATATGIVISDPKQEGNPILFANDAFCLFTDCDLSSLSEGGWDSISSLFSDNVECERYLSVIKNCEEAEFDLDYSFDTKEGGRRHFTLVLTPAFHDGQLDLYMGLLSDVTLARQREAEAFKSQRLESLGELAAGVAHDFNNVLSIIGGYTAMMKKTLPKNYVEEERYLERVEVATKRGADLARKMLTFSSHKVVEKVTLDMCDLISEHVAFLEPIVGAAINVKVSLPEDERSKGVYVKGSASSVEQVFMNFVVNARDAMVDGGDLEVALSCLDKKDVPSHVSEKMDGVDDFVCLSVTDTGIGMDDETVERIFDPFFTTKEQGKGTGLGLSVVYGLAKELDGQLDVVSKLGHGTTMFLYLPRSDGEGARVFSGDVKMPETVRLDGYTALVAEDEPDILDIVVNMLEGLGMKVLSASNGDDALLVQEDFEGKIDLLLTDILMPGLNGVKLAELVTALRSDIKVIFMSGFPAKGEMIPVELPEDASFLAKPVAHEKLVQMLCFSLIAECANSDISDGGMFDMPRWKSVDDVMGRSS